MSNQTLPQIAEKLNEEFDSSQKKIIFWYDKNKEFEEDIALLKELLHAEIFFLEKRGQLKAKVYITKEHPEENFLVYAPFEKPELKKNLFADMLHYGKEFHADRLSMIITEHGIQPELRYILEKNTKFFDNKSRWSRFDKFIEHDPTEEQIKLSLLASLAKVRDVATLESILITVLTSDAIENNSVLTEFDKFDLEEVFWEEVGRVFGFYHPTPTLNRLVIAMYLNYFHFLMSGAHKELPESYSEFQMKRLGNLGVFMSNMKNNVQMSARFDELAEEVFQKIKGAELLKNTVPDTLVENDVFYEIDEYLIKWATDRLVHGDYQIKVSGLTIHGLSHKRIQLHFGERVKNHYKMLKHAWYLVQLVDKEYPEHAEEIVSTYESEDFQIDMHYRKFYYYFDLLEEELKEQSADLRKRIENLYNYKFLEQINKAWSSSFNYLEIAKNIPLQRDFYKNIVREYKGKVVVIISDALRYEAVKELKKRMTADIRNSLKMSSMLSTLPSITKIGKAALLPNHEISLTDSYKVLVDGLPTDSTIEREKILQVNSSGARAVNYKEVVNLKRDDMRSYFRDQTAEVIYIYHDSVDAIGDKSSTEDTVFEATERAIIEIQGLIEKFFNTLSIANFVVTSDHGYIYKRDPIEEAAKLENPKKVSDEDGRRYIISEHKYDRVGIHSVPMKDILGNNDQRYISLPKTTTIFKKPGGGQNYVHGGASIQEMLIPVLEIRRERGQYENHRASIRLLTGQRTVSNLFTNLEFIQSDIVGSGILPSKYALYFEAKDGEKISDNQIYLANNQSVAPNDRMFRMNFQLKEKAYDKSQSYYFVIYDLVNEVIFERHEFHIDIAFSGGFGFDI
ncbi:BREX-1 system phosphatase PglZ type A [Enterococcus sp. CWB-B31]|uniref:BREX-1 system phosphatase PglZ type A n=1 Tax=Enterococcus sp. CWB-B31 TaxID=2885159 RepID=UPI001E2D7F14|nr:BREX-1 system phosphatase PglZ type A [Enterococcus sp. CWB-B31]MCB5955571.1 BREX-1 system phosphatase PglZ type A [Enterococcus sp. CWB-B31]